MLTIFRHLFLQFNYAVEIGANMAYMGHYAVTKDPVILQIAHEELDHQYEIYKILGKYGKKPTKFFNIPFKVIGTIIQNLCYVSPKWSLDFIARMMEKFAIFNYNYLAKLYPEHRLILLAMAIHESQHEKYFKEGIKPPVKRKGFFDNIHIYRGPKDWID